MRQNDGFVHVDSEPGHGSTFKVYLPRHAQKPAHAAPGPAAGLPTGTETVLLVEDEVALLRLTTKMLEQLGYAVLPAGGVGQAMEVVEAHRGEIHLLVSDVVMPDASGRDLFERLARLRPSLLARGAGREDSRGARSAL